MTKQNLVMLFFFVWCLVSLGLAATLASLNQAASGLSNSTSTSPTTSTATSNSANSSGSNHDN